MAPCRVGLLIVAGMLAVTASSTAAADTGVLQTVSTRTLAASGITLDPASPTIAVAITRSQAERVAIGRSRDTIVLESALARVTTHLLDGRLCWVVSVSPTDGIWSFGPPGSPRLRGTWELEFIDATSGEDLGGAAGGQVR